MKKHVPDVCRRPALARSILQSFRHALPVLAFWLWVAWVPKAGALGVRVPNQDASAIARGNAFVATADDPSAIYYNPAGITQLDGQHVRAGVYGIYLNDHYKGDGMSINTH